jgi:nickel/cobalt exporter
MRHRSRLALLVVPATAALIAVSGPAVAHPLGNFTVNRFSGIEVFPDRIVVHYVVDMAEIPTFQEMAQIDADSDDRADYRELAAYARDVAARLKGNISLTADGEAVALGVEEASAGLSAGGGGLDVLRIDAELAGALEDPEAVLQYRDVNYAGRPGWKEVVSYGTGGQGLVSASVPSTSASNELRSYPRDLLSSPSDVTEAVVQVAPGAAPATPGSRARAPEVGAGELFAGAFASLIEREPSPAFLVFALLLAIGAGALHALGPGHGKTVMAAYLVGTEGRARHAVAVGVAISLMHTASVVALGLVTLWASNLFAPERVYPYLSLVSGVVVVGLGAWLLRARLAARRIDSRDRDQAHNGHDHAGHAHGHADHDDGHAHHDHEELPARRHSHGGGYHTHGPHPASGRSPLSGRGLVALALSGGLLPSPTALVVLLGSIALHRVAFGVVLVAAFSAGLAGALTLLGILVLRARAFARARLGHRWSAWIPISSAAAILAMGLFLTTRAAVGL